MKGQSVKWVMNDKTKLCISDNDVIVKVNTDAKGLPIFHNIKLRGKTVTAIVGDVEKQPLLSLKNREVWTCIFNANGQPTSIKGYNANKLVTLIIDENIMKGIA